MSGVLNLEQLTSSQSQRHTLVVMSHARLSVLDWQRYQDDLETDPTWSSREHPGGVKLTGNLRDEKTGASGDKEKR